MLYEPNLNIWESAYVEVSSQLHAPAASLPGKEDPVTTEYKTKWTE